MTLKFRTAALCALLGAMAIGVLAPPSARAIRPSDLSLQAEPAQAESEQASAGVFGIYVTLTDPSTGVAVLNTVLPRGWTAQMQTN